MSCAAIYALALASGLALVGYLVTWTVAFPMLADDVGNWLEPVGAAPLVFESHRVHSGDQRTAAMSSRLAH